MRQRTATTLIAATLLLSACAAPADRAAMAVPYSPALAEPDDRSLVGSIAVASIEGGRETGPLSKSQVGNEDFQGALTDSLREHGLLAEGTAPSYILSARLVDLRQPIIGLSMTVRATVEYELVDAVNGRPTLARAVETSHTTAFGEAFGADDRTRLATEGAIRENIRQFLAWLSRKPAPMT
ncbi:hypothetical protein JL100_035535 (plasmid) [Skermanella mucosa]|uniref:hypothetical protein n=1 Tax=Skermanella mucosa TaxID=1789672 RepID=UPI00192ABC54|nr:hypothetical protein [Skermanella mucosa]UEM25368.1 hypothetical protein JL100_035535 [Skermanella mucosa]